MKTPREWFETLNPKGGEMVVVSRSTIEAMVEDIRNELWRHLESEDNRPALWVNEMWDRIKKAATTKGEAK